MLPLRLCLLKIHSHENDGYNAERSWHWYLKWLEKMILVVEKSFSIPINLRQVFSLWWSECPLGTSTFAMFHRHCEIAIAQLSTIMMAVKSLALDGKKMREQCNFQIRKLVLIPFVCIGPLWLPCVVYLKSLLTPQAPIAMAATFSSMYFFYFWEHTGKIFRRGSDIKSSLKLWTNKSSLTWFLGPQ